MQRLAPAALDTPHARPAAHHGPAAPIPRAGCRAGDSVVLTVVSGNAFDSAPTVEPCDTCKACLEEMQARARAPFFAMRRPLRGQCSPRRCCASFGLGGVRARSHKCWAVCVHAHTHPPPPPRQTFTGAVDSSANAAAVANAFEAACRTSGRDTPDCISVTRQISASKDGNLGRRPAALCFRLGECLPSLACVGSAKNASNVNQTLTGELDACTASGIKGGAAVGADLIGARRRAAEMCCALLGCVCAARAYVSARAGSRPEAHVAARSTNTPPLAPCARSRGLHVRRRLLLCQDQPDPQGLLCRQHRRHLHLPGRHRRLLVRRHLRGLLRCARRHDQRAQRRGGWGPYSSYSPRCAAQGGHALACFGGRAHAMAPSLRPVAASCCPPAACPPPARSHPHARAAGQALLQQHRLHHRERGVRDDRGRARQVL